jgi:DNA invertase Pin-like site-specific DNA recombinase
MDYRTQAMRRTVYCDQHRLEGQERLVPLADQADGHYHAARELLFSNFGALAQYERALIRAGNSRAGSHQMPEQARGRPPALSTQQVEQITSALNNGASKASVCRSFKALCSTLLDR